MSLQPASTQILEFSIFGIRSSRGSVPKRRRPSSSAITNASSTLRARGSGHGSTRMSNRWEFLATAAALALLLPAPALAQDAGTLPLQSEEKAEAIDLSKQPTQNLSPADELKVLQSERREMQQRMNDFDARIDSLETRLGVAHPPPPATLAVPVPVPQPGQQPEQQQASVEPPKNPVDAFLQRQELAGTFKRDTGWVLVDEPIAREYLGLMTYARYLNQNALNDTYTDSFGRVIAI